MKKLEIAFEQSKTILSCISSLQADEALADMNTVVFLEEESYIVILNYDLPVDTILGDDSSTQQSCRGFLVGRQ